MKKYISRFKISMKNILSMQCFECISKLQKYLDGLLFCKSPLWFDMLSQSSTVTKLIDKIIVIGSSKHLYKFDNIYMVDLRKNSYLVVGELTQFRCMLKFLYVHHLYCIRLLVLTILSLVDVTVLPLSNLFKQNVVLYDFVHSIVW
jgi:hypothetical protein